MKNKNDTAHLALFIVACAGFLNQKLYQLIEFQNEQIRVLKDLNTSQKKLSNDDRRRLARLAHDIETKILQLSETIVTISTIREWYRKLIAKTNSWGYSISDMVSSFCIKSSNSSIHIYSYHFSIITRNKTS